jgi:hypothetical protein
MGTGTPSLQILGPGSPWPCLQGVGVLVRCLWISSTFPAMLKSKHYYTSLLQINRGIEKQSNLFKVTQWTKGEDTFSFFFW